MNKVVLIGRLTKDPELRFTPGKGSPVTTFTLAVDKLRKKDGENQADFIQIVVWGKQAENVANYMLKGSQVAISGRIQTRNYEAKDGTKRYVTEVVAAEVQFLGKAKGQDNASSSNNPFDDMKFEEDLIPVDDGDMPF